MDPIGPTVRRLLPCLLLLAPLACESESGPQGEPLGQEGAHEHGVADVSLVAEGQGATVSFRAPAGDLYGFEGGEPTQDEREVARDALQRLESSMVAMLGIPAELGCRVTEVSWSGAAEEVLAPVESGGGEGDTEPDGGADQEHDHDHDHGSAGGEEESQAGEAEEDDAHGHSDVIGDFSIACSEALAGATLRLAFTDHLEAIEKIDLQTVSTDRQFGRRVPASGVRIRL